MGGKFYKRRALKCRERRKKGRKKEVKKEEREKRKKERKRYSKNLELHRYDGGANGVVVIGQREQDLRGDIVGEVSQYIESSALLQRKLSPVHHQHLMHIIESDLYRQYDHERRVRRCVCRRARGVWRRERQRLSGRSQWPSSTDTSGAGPASVRPRPVQSPPLDSLFIHSIERFILCRGTER